MKISMYQVLLFVVILEVIELLLVSWVRLMTQTNQTRSGVNNCLACIEGIGIITLAISCFHIVHPLLSAI